MKNRQSGGGIADLIISFFQRLQADEIVRHAVQGGIAQIGAFTHAALT